MGSIAADKSVECFRDVIECVVAEFAGSCVQPVLVSCVHWRRIKIDQKKNKSASLSKHKLHSAGLRAIGVEDEHDHVLFI